MAWNRKMEDIKTTPLKYIEWIISISSIFGGAYILTPLLRIPVPSVDSAIFNLIGSEIGIFFLGVMYIGSGIYMLLGLAGNDKKVRKIGLFWNIIARLYTVLGQIFIYGFFPLNWLSNFTIACVAVVIWLVISMELKDVRT